MRYNILGTTDTMSCFYYLNIFGDTSLYLAFKYLLHAETKKPSEFEILT